MGGVFFFGRPEYCILVQNVCIAVFFLALKNRVLSLFFCVVIVVIKIQRNKNFAPAVALLVHCPFRVFFVLSLSPWPPSARTRRHLLQWPYTPSTVSRNSAGCTTRRTIQSASPGACRLRGRRILFFLFALLKFYFVFPFASPKNAASRRSRLLSGI